MKKILMAATAALCFAGSSFAQENPGGDLASDSASGGMKMADKIGLGFTLLTVTAANVLNARGDSRLTIGPDPDPDPDPACGAGEELVDGECVPITTTTTVTTTVTNTVTSTLTTPVTVTATITSL
jgi:hypothetical protein